MGNLFKNWNGQRSKSGVYPLYGHAMIEAEDGEMIRVEVEDLRGWPKGDPQWEVLAPAGYVFGYPDRLHCVLCFTLNEARHVIADCDPGPCFCDDECMEHWMRNDKQTS